MNTYFQYLQQIPDTYWLKRDSEERNRLAWQDEFYERTLGYKIHPKIWESLPRQKLMADIATGTGVWPLNIASQGHFFDYPHYDRDVKIDAYDLDGSMFPDIYPDNISFHSNQNAKNSFPDALKGKYDFVHIRLLTAGMTNISDWERVAYNAMELLKPGGWIQWVEGDFRRLATVYRNVRGMVRYKQADWKVVRWPDRRVVRFTPQEILEGTLASDAENKNEPNQPTQRLSQLMNALMSQPAVQNCIRGGWWLLPDIFERLGMQDITSDCVKSDREPEDRWESTKLMMCTARNGLLAHGYSWPEAEAMYRLANIDLDAGAYVSFDICVVFARKPDYVRSTERAEASTRARVGRHNMDAENELDKRNGLGHPDRSGNGFFPGQL